MLESMVRILLFHLQQYICKNKDMITTLMIVIFVLGYIAIALERPLKVDKAASALIIGGLGWALYSFTGVSQEELSHEVKHHLVDIAEILFFLLGAMTIVELIDAH